MHDDKRVRVMLVDDHEMVRSGLAVFLSGFDYLELVGQAADAATALRLCGELNPDVILMDLVMPGVDGITATRMIRDAYPGIRIIALTSFSDEELVERAIQAGAIGFLYKNASVDELASAIMLAHSGKPALSPDAAKTLLRVVTTPAAPQHQRNYGLTEREKQVLECLIDGYTNRQIALKLEISPATVKAYVSSVLSKLGVSSRTEAATLALKEKIMF